MATLQCTRYVHNPKRSHKLALICIGRYLKETLDKGLVFKPIDTELLQAYVYVDARTVSCFHGYLGTGIAEE